MLFQVAPMKFSMGKSDCLLLTLLFGICTASQEKVTCEYKQMTAFLHDLAANYSHLAQLKSMGTTEEGRELWVLIVSDSPTSRPLLRPQVKFVGNVNGMSGSACYVALRLAQHLFENYADEASMERKLLESVEIHVIPNLNPDGYARAQAGSCVGKEGRMNAHGVNLNTNFPDVFQSEEPATPLQKETDAMIQWMHQNKFTLSVSLIGGARVVVYPWDAITHPDDLDELPTDGTPHITPDDDIFKHLALTYAHASGAAEHPSWYCPQLGRTFPQGIINGAEWKPQSGTMMDFNYVEGVFEIMVGVSCCRNPDNVTLLEETWRENRQGLLYVASLVNNGGGIRGLVVEADTGQPITHAQLSRQPWDYIFMGEGSSAMFSMSWGTSARGEFWRPWLPGHYKLRVEAAGFNTKVVHVQVHEKAPTIMQVELERIGSPTTTTTTTQSSVSQPSLQDADGQENNNDIDEKQEEYALAFKTASGASGNRVEHSFRLKVTVFILNHCILQLFRTLI